MPREIIILECTEAKAEGKPVSRYVSTRNKKSLRTPGRLEKVKFNPFLKRRTLHREIRYFSPPIPMQPKTTERLISLRKNNRRMPRRRADIPMDRLNYCNPEILARFLTETGKLQPRRVTGLPAWLHRKVTREVKRARAVNLLP